MTIINDITQMNPIEVKEVFTPHSIEEIQKTVKQAETVSIGGGRFSMGGQIASENSTHIDMRQFNQVLHLDESTKTIRVQTGIKWQEILEVIDEKELSISIMQTYSAFTVGGSLSVNVHGRYIGLGPLILSVLEIKLVLANGEVITATPKENREYFFGAIGGYGGLGVIVEAVLQLTDNVNMARSQKQLATIDYWPFFKETIRESKNVIFHNADMYPPHYEKVSSITWTKTDKALTEKRRITKAKAGSWLHRYFIWSFARSAFGKWRRHNWLEPLFYKFNRVVTRNYEASYDLAELEPIAILGNCYILQEYFIPVEKINEFIPVMKEIFNRHKVNVVNISIRHAFHDSGSMLAWANKEVFAFVVYYREATTAEAYHKTGVWTREMINAALSLSGSYYLPYQPHATEAQFHQAYPRAKEFFALKQNIDPSFKFRNILWNKYYPYQGKQTKRGTSRFKNVFADTTWSDKFYLFLQSIFSIMPACPFHKLIDELCENHETDEAIYRNVQEKLPSIKPKLSDLFYGLPALRLQKDIIAKQTAALLNNAGPLDGYLEIGSTGRYVKPLKKILNLNGPIYLIHERAPNMSPPDLLERGQLSQIGKFYLLDDYVPISTEIPDESLSLVTCYIGLHHCRSEKLDAFIESFKRVLKPGGYFILRDHDVTSPEMDDFVSLVHDVFNAGLNETWQYNEAEFRDFKSVDEWISILEKHGFEASKARLLQENDPTLNTLLLFQKTDD